MKAKLLMPMIRAAIEASESMRPQERADVFDGIASVAGGFDRKLAAEARRLSEAIRESEMLQMHFRNLLSEKGAGS